MGPAITEEDRGHLRNCRVVSSVSGGKDSSAMSLWLTEQEIDHDRIHALTGWDHDETVSYIEHELQEALGPITFVRGERLMADLIRHKKMFPGRLRRYCTEQLKVMPIKRFLESYDCDVVNAVGIRAAESEARSKLSRWEPWDAADCMVWRPLIEWSEQDVIAIHHRHGLRPNPLYLRGAQRVGCWPCIFARKQEIRLVAELSPERIDEIRALELELGDWQEARNERDGKEFDRPTFFHGRSHKDNVPMPIDEAVAWSKTAYGGKQLLLLETEPPGCVRWGMCEAQPDE